MKRFITFVIAVTLCFPMLAFARRDTGPRNGHLTMLQIYPIGEILTI